MCVYEKFQQDLRDGAGISETLAKYNLTFKETFDYLHYPAKHNNMPSHDTKKVADYIYKVGGKYHVRRRTSKRVFAYFGSYNSLSDAQKIVDYFQKNSWDKRKVDYACRKLGITRNKRGGNHK